MTPRGAHLAVLFSIVVAAAVSFVVAALLLGLGRKEKAEAADDAAADLDAAQAEVADRKAAAKAAAGAPRADEAPSAGTAH